MKGLLIDALLGDPVMMIMSPESDAGQPTIWGG